MTHWALRSWRESLAGESGNFYGDKLRYLHWRLMSNHTNGPWIIQRGPHSDGHFEVGSNDGGGFFTVARVKGFSRHDAEANARLIAAAPELLQVCKQVSDEIGSHDYHGGISMLDCLNKLVAVIAKAEGR